MVARNERVGDREEKRRREKILAPALLASYFFFFYSAWAPSAQDWPPTFSESPP
jgi:hypothetical protein